MPRRCGLRFALILLFAGSAAFAQPPGESVLVPAKDYQKLLDDLEAAKKAKAAKPLPTSVCHVACELKLTKDRPLAVLTNTYQFRTTLPRASVLLGGQRAFAVKASLDDGGPPALDTTADGLVAIIDDPGEHTLSITFETAIAARSKGDLGFDVGLPRAAITTLSLASPNAEIKSLNLGTRWLDAASKPGELKVAAIEPGKLAKDYPLGPTDILDLSWDVPKTVPPPSEPTLDAEVSVRVDDARIETTALLKLRGPAKEWTLALPLGAELAGNAAIVKPADAKKREWKVTLKDAGETTLTAILRTPRSDPKEAKSFSVGPFFALGMVRQSGTVKLFAPPTLRLIPRPTQEVRRVETPPAAAEESPVAVFRFSYPPLADRKPATLLDIDLRAASGFVVVQPHHALTLSALGWKLHSEYRIAPVRTAIENVSIELPAGWQNPTFSPLDLVEEVQGSSDASTPRTLIVRLASPQREPFELVLEARWPLMAEMREAALPLPHILSARERESQIAAAVPESLELNGSVREGEFSKPAETASALKHIKHFSLNGSFDGSVARVDLAWLPFRAKLAAEIRADVTLTDRQLAISQTLKFSFPEGAGKAVRLSGPSAAVGFRANPALETLGPGEWSFTPPAGAKDATLTLSYAMPVKLAETSIRQVVPLVWPEATTANTTVRFWSTAAGRRAAGFDGPWRESPAEPSPERDALPSLTLSSSGVNVPLALDLAEADPTGSVIVDRAVYQWWMTEAGGVQARARFLLRRWPASLDIDLAGATGITALVDKARVEPSSLRGETVRFPLPEAKPTRQTILLELRFTGPPSTAWTRVRLDPPRLRGAVFRSPAWWQIAPPSGSLPFTYNGDLVPEIGWQWAAPWLTPAAGLSNDDLDRWLSDGHDADGDALPGDRAVTARQALPASVRVVRIPRLIGMLIGSGVVLVIGVLIARLRTGWRAALLGTLAVIIAVAAVLYPQPMAEATLALQPGLALLILAFAGQALLRTLLKNRNAKTATFMRGIPVNAIGTATAPSLELSAQRSRKSGVATTSSRSATP